MPGLADHPAQPWYVRLPPLLGTAVLVLTATPWMSRPVDVPEVSGNVQAQYSLWGMLATVSSAMFGLLVTAIVLIMVSVVAAVLPTRARGIRVLASWAGVLAIGGIMINIDAGYSPAAGAVLALVLATAGAAALTTGVVVQARQRTLAG